MNNLISHTKNGTRNTNDPAYTAILFIRKSRELFGDRYTYKNYKGSTKLVTIYDKVLDVEYEQYAQDHIRGNVPIKVKDSIANYDVFLEKSKEHHGDKFEYLNFDWKNRKIHLKEVSTGKLFTQSVYESGGIEFGIKYAKDELNSETIAWENKNVEILQTIYETLLTIKKLKLQIEQSDYSLKNKDTNKNPDDFQ